MTTWNYRVFREAAGDLVVREVVYDAHGQILSCSRDAVPVAAESIDALVQLLDELRSALRLPILSLADVPGAEGSPPVGQQLTFSHAEVLAALGLEQHPRRGGTTKRQAS